MRQQILALLFILAFIELRAQTDTAAAEMIDFSQFEAVEPVNTQRFVTNKVLGLSPTKLLSLGFDFQSRSDLKNMAPDDTSGTTLNSISGIRIIANYPVVSNTRWIVNLGGFYNRSSFAVASPSPNSFLKAIEERGLTNTGINATVFKPLNEKYFVLGFVQSEFNGDFSLSSGNAGSYFSQPKVTLAGLWGFKRNDRSMIAFGLSRTYRPGAKGVIPLILYNHTFENRKWGIESFFPARAAVRRTFNPRNILLVGYELEGSSYSLNNLGNSNYPGSLELRRSELRPRITYERSLSGFIWVSLQAGYRINYNFDIDREDSFRMLGSDDPYYMTNTLSNPFYFHVSLNLVSP